MLTWQWVATIQAIALAVMLSGAWLGFRHVHRRSLRAVVVQDGIPDSRADVDKVLGSLGEKPNPATNLKALESITASPEESESSSPVVDLSETQLAWMRLRASLDATLQSIAESGLTQASNGPEWDDIQRLLCAADRLHAVPSPELKALPSIESADGQWAHLIQQLSNAKTAGANERDAEGKLPEQYAPVLAALLDTIGELRGEPLPAAQGESQREADLKKMISQFTQDSRDMLASIRRLESENLQLRDAVTAQSADASRASNDPS